MYLHVSESFKNCQIVLKTKQKRLDVVYKRLGA